MSEDFLADGIRLVQSGEFTQAAALLSKAVQVDPHSTQAWLWLGRVLEEPARKKFCFEKALELEPELAEARLELEHLQSHAPVFLDSTRRVSPLSSGSPSPQSAFIDTELPEGTPDSQPPPSDVPAFIAAATPVSSRPVIPPAAPSASGVSTPAQPVEPPPAPVQAEAETPAASPEPDIPPELTPEEELRLDVERRSRRSPKAMTVLVIVLSLCFLLVCLPGAYLALTGKLSTAIGPRVPSLPAQSAVTPTSGATSTPSPEPSITPTRTPAGTATLNVQRQLLQAKQFMDQKRYREAVPLWDEVIAARPGLAEAYYQRAIARIEQVDDLKKESDYNAYLNSAIADLDKAIASGSATGDEYVYRAYAYSDLASGADFRVDQDYLYKIALENLEAGCSRGSNVLGSDAEHIFLLLNNGRCDEALDEANRLPKPALDPDGVVTKAYRLAAESYLCLDQNSKARDSINSALKLLYPSSVEKLYAAIVLYNAGQPDQSLTVLDQSISASPNGAGERYFWRALYYYDQGRTDLVQNDLAAGESNSWSRRGIYEYIKGKMAIDDGQRQQGIQLLQIAEAGISSVDGPALLARVRRDLAALGASPLSPAVSVTITTTPIALPK